MGIILLPILLCLAVCHTGHKRVSVAGTLFLPHSLIREYRENKKIKINSEHLIMMQMTSDYDHLSLIQKVEVFEHGWGWTAWVSSGSHRPNAGKCDNPRSISLPCELQPCVRTKNVVSECGTLLRRVLQERCSVLKARLATPSTQKCRRRMDETTPTLATSKSLGLCRVRLASPEATAFEISCVAGRGGAGCPHAPVASASRGALENTDGQDLNKVLWLHSENSELWLDWAVAFPLAEDCRLPGERIPSTRAVPESRNPTWVVRGLTPHPGG